MKKKHNNKYQKFSRTSDDAELPEVNSYQPIKRKGHGDQRKANQLAKQMRQDLEYHSAITETHHAA